MDDCDHSAPMQPEMDAMVAREAMKQGDLPHAAHHVATALSRDPERADFLALLDDLVGLAGGPEAALALFPIEGGTWFGQAAVHAWLLHAGGHVHAAADLLCQVAVARPDVAYLPWLLPWLADPGLEASNVHASLSRLLMVDQPPAGALQALQTLRERFPDDAPVWSLSAMLTRRAGRLDEALELAQQTYDRAPSWTSAVALANAFRALDRWEDAQSAWTAALEHDPDDLGVRLDWGDAHLERWELDEARRRYAEVDARQPEHPWAHPSLMYVAWAQQPSVAARRALQLWSEAHPDNGRALDLAERATPWLGYLPLPTEATTNMLPQMVEALAGQDPGSTITLTLSHLEPPSSQWVAREVARQAGGTLQFQVEAVATPDLRVPRFEASLHPWAWDGTVVVPGLPRPSEATMAAVLGLAQMRYHAPSWLDAAPQIDDAQAVVAAALYPTPAPSWAPPSHWAWRWAHAAAFVLAGQPGWQGTAHRDALRSMVAVRNDWLTVAAVVALGERARRDDAVRAEVQELLLDILRSGPDGGYWCVGWPATVAMLRGATGDDAELEAVMWDHVAGFEDPGE